MKPAEAQMTRPEPGTPLRCLECGRLSEGEAPGWRAYVLSSFEGSEETEVLIYCPACAEREFGDDS